MQRLVVIKSDTLSLISSEVQSPRHEAVEARSFCFLIHHTASRTASEGDSGWTLQHFNLVHVEGIAVVAAEVTHAIEEDVVASGKATDGQTITLCAPLAGGQADAGDVAQGVTQGSGTLVLNDVLRNDVDGLRSFHQ